jgi:benzoyl-CoA reductase/2-hydroxyglutaryl-CoA dehydratase subunit BcrC/BadD/HgdB
VTDESLKNAIICGNAARSNMAALDACMASEMVPLKPLEYFLVQAMLGDCAGDPKTFNLLLSNLLDELNIRIERSAAVQTFPPTRIYLIGDETQELGIYNAIEDHGAAVVGCNSRLPLYYCPVDENAEPLSALAQWIWRMPNNLPVKSRIELEITAIKRQQPDAIIINSNVGSRCSPGLERLYRDVLKQHLGIPVLCIETSFPGENLDKVDYQVSALVQTITAGY